MKRKAILFASALAFAIVASAFTFVNHQSSAPGNHAKVLLNYTWYMDEDLTIPNGACSDVVTELNRLRSMYPSYTFSSTPIAGCHAYEWGQYTSAPLQIIYSNR
jgi:hypothetical protein